MTVFVTQSDIQLSGPGLIGSDVAGSGVRRSKRITIGAGLTLSGGVLTNTLDLSGYLPLAGGTLSGALTIPAGSAAAPSIAITGLTGGGGLCTSAPSRIELAWGGSIKHTFWSDGSYYQNDENAELKIANRVSLFSSASHVLEQRSGLNAQCFDLFETYTSSTNNGKLRFKATSSGHQIGSARAASGSNRTVNFGHFDASDVFTAALKIGTDGHVMFPTGLYDNANQRQMAFGGGFIQVEQNLYVQQPIFHAARSTITVDNNYGSIWVASTSGTKDGITYAVGDVLITTVTSSVSKTVLLVDYSAI